MTVIYGAGDTEMFEAGLSKLKFARLIVEIIWFSTVKVR